MHLLLAIGFARELGVIMGKWLQSEPPVAYHEMSIHLSRIHGDCGALLRSFAYDCKIPQTLIPVLSPNIDINGTNEGGFNFTVAERVVGPMFTELKAHIGQVKEERGDKFAGQAASYRLLDQALQRSESAA